MWLLQHIKKKWNYGKKEQPSTNPNLTIIENRVYPLFLLVQLALLATISSSCRSFNLRVSESIIYFDVSLLLHMLWFHLIFVSVFKEELNPKAFIKTPLQRYIQSSVFLCLLSHVALQMLRSCRNSSLSSNYLCKQH